MVPEAVERRINRNLPRLRFFNRALWPDHDDDLPKLLYYLAHGDPKAKVGGSMSAQPPTSASEPGIAVESAALGATLPTAVMRYAGPRLTAAAIATTSALGP